MRQRKCIFCENSENQTCTWLFFFVLFSPFFYFRVLLRVQYVLHSYFTNGYIYNIVNNDDKTNYATICCYLVASGSM